ncbi:MAG: hypothetical protein JOZ54_23915, partial [Acidobacteria bacterium]|nr:hypothetical protein [Acidobacteriota bacterium]
SDATAQQVTWSFHEVPTEAKATHRYVGKLSYIEKRAAHKGVHCAANVEIETDESVHLPWLGALPFFTGIDGIDQTLSASAPTIHGFPMRISVTATREYSGGEKRGQQRTMTVRDIHEIAGSVDDH